jgi:hypothetical protein
MKKILAAAAFTLTALCTNPLQSSADWNNPQTRYGMGWLEGRALNSKPWLHFHGPLYNYGPYTAPGHLPMFIENPKIGAYTPAYPPAYYGYEFPGYYPTTIAPYFPARPMPTLTAPTNLHYSQAEPPMATPVADGSAPAANQSVVSPTPQSAAPSSYSGRPGIFGQFRTTGFRR